MLLSFHHFSAAGDANLRFSIRKNKEDRSFIAAMNEITLMGVRWNRALRKRRMHW